MQKRELTAERLREVLDYNPETGVFRRKIAGGYKSKVGDIAGARRARGDFQINVDGKNYLAHRLAWLYVKGEWPQGWLDHINGHPGDNAFRNLRIANGSQNNCNRRTRRDNLSGLKGVTQDRRDQRYSARIKIKGRRTSLGYFDTPEEAHAAYCRASADLHGEFGRTK
jgi:hypothetical protein